MPDQAALIRLRQEIRADTRVARQRLDDLHRHGGPALAEADQVVLGYLAVTLHQLYTAVESVFERICRTLEHSMPVGSDSHAALLRDMTMDLSPIRPPVIAIETWDSLRPLLRFRHFVRRAYAVSWEGDKIQAALADAERAWPLLERDVLQFLGFVDAVIEELGA